MSILVWRVAPCPIMRRRASACNAVYRWAPCKPTPARASHRWGRTEAPEPADLDMRVCAAGFGSAADFDSQPAGHGWRIDVPLHLDRRQAVYLGYAGVDVEGLRVARARLGVRAGQRPRTRGKLLKLNAHTVEGHFAIRVLRGEEYFVVIENLPADAVDRLDPSPIVRRIAVTADSLEDRLSRGKDLY